MTGIAREHLFDLVHESIFVRDMDGRILSWNPASAQLYGWSVDEAVGRNAHDLLGAGHDQPVEALEAALLAQGRWDGELVRRAADGAERRIEVRWSLRREADGTPGQIIELGRDVTRRKAAEAALRTSERRYFSLFQAMAASFWELDFSGVGAMLRDLRKAGVTDFPAHFAAHADVVREMMRRTRIVDVNDETVKLFASGDRSRLTESVEPFWASGSEAVYAASVIAAISGAPHYASETRFRRPDGSEFDALFTACFPGDTVAEGTLLIGVIDISARKQAMAELQQVQADFAHAARVSMLGELTASIAHEVNQPLAAIATNGAAAMRWLGRETPDVEQGLKLTGRIVADAQRAGDIISRIRAMAANRPVALEPLSVNGVIRESARFLVRELQVQGASLTLVLEPGLPEVPADRTQLQQVLVNLAVNALQAMAEAKASVREVEMRSRLAGDRVEISVQDTGPGLAPDQIERLFQSFFTTKAAGMGMGLAICRSILEAHGGDISAANAPRGGAVFTLTLPTA